MTYGNDDCYVLNRCLSISILLETICSIHRMMIFVFPNLHLEMKIIRKGYELYSIFS